MRSRVGDSVQIIFVACSVLCLSTGAAIQHQQETTEQSAGRAKKATQNEQGDPAENLIKHSSVLKAKSAESHFNDAQVYLREGARSMAAESVARALENQPLYPEAHLLLARCLAADNKPDKAREEVNIAIAQGISISPAYRLLAEIDTVKGDFEAAISSFETALRFSTTSDDLDESRIRKQIEELRELAVNVEIMGAIEGLQKAPDIIRPVLLEATGPRYTEEARQLKIQGSVSMFLVVSEQGDVSSALIYRSLGHGLDEEAMVVARKIKFSPATQAGKPIRYWTRLSVEFNLR